MLPLVIPIFKQYILKLATGLLSVVLVGWIDSMHRRLSDGITPLLKISGDGGHCHLFASWLWISGSVMKVEYELPPT
jgi:hypothetical protein